MLEPDPGRWLRKRHHCKLPDLDDAKMGDIWQCACGDAYQRDHTDFGYEAVWRRLSERDTRRAVKKWEKAHA